MGGPSSDVNFLTHHGTKTRAGQPEKSVPNADACWLMRVITADSACIAIPKILFVKFLSRLTNEELLHL